MVNKSLHSCANRAKVHKLYPSVEIVTTLQLLKDLLKYPPLYK